MSVVAKLSVSVVLSKLEDGINKFLVVREIQNDRIVYNFPSGHIEPGESPFEAAVRELLEETGYECLDLKSKSTFILNGRKNENVYVSFLFSGTIFQKIRDVTDPEISDVLWLTGGELNELRESWRNDLLLMKINQVLFRPDSIIDYS